MKYYRLAKIQARNGFKYIAKFYSSSEGDDESILRF